MRNLTGGRLIAGGLFFASTILFFGNQNSVFASDREVAIEVAGTTLTRPGTPYISAGENSFKPTWSWDASKSLIAGPIHYFVQWCAMPDFSGCQNNKMYTSSNLFSFDDSNSLSNGTWYLRVQSMDEFGNKSPFSKTGTGSINNYNVSAPVNIAAKLAGNTVSLGWNDCGGLTFKVWRSTSGENGNFEVISKTQDYTLDTNLGSIGKAWYYLTAVDEWGNESPPSSVIKVENTGFLEANTPTFTSDWAAIFEPIWHGFSLGSEQVAGDSTSSVVPENEDDNGGFLGIIPHDYFKLN